VSLSNAISLKTISVARKTKSLQKGTLLCRQAVERACYTLARLPRNQSSQPASSTSYVQSSLNMSNLTRSCADFLSFQSEVTMLARDSAVKFSFLYGGHRHIFQANTVSERDSWLKALYAKRREVKPLRRRLARADGHPAFHISGSAWRAARTGQAKSQDRIG
jgi:hypothetical protein